MRKYNKGILFFCLNVKNYTDEYYVYLLVGIKDGSHLVVNRSADSRMAVGRGCTARIPAKGASKFCAPPYYIFKHTYM